MRMYIKDLKKMIADLPDDMPVNVPYFENGKPRAIIGCCCAGIAKVAYNDVFTIVSSPYDNSLKELIERGDTNSLAVRELFPEKKTYEPTLGDYKNSGLFLSNINGYILYDYLSNRKLENDEKYMNCKVVAIGYDDEYRTVFYIDTLY